MPFCQAGLQVVHVRFNSQERDKSRAQSPAFLSDTGVMRGKKGKVFETQGGVIDLRNTGEVLETRV